MTVYDDQYNDMNAGAHRRPPPQIAAPALAWQRGFWKPDQKYADANGIRLPTDDEWRENIDRVLYALFLYLKRRSKSRFTSPNLDRSVGDNGILYLFRWKSDLNVNDWKALEPAERSVRHDIFQFRGNIDGMMVTVVGRLHYEYFTLSFTGEFAKGRNRTSGEVGAFRDRIIELHNLAIRRSQTPKAVDMDPPLSQAEQSLVDGMAAMLVEPFKVWISALCDSAFGSIRTHGNADLTSCGGVFANIFGLILSLKISDELINKSADKTSSPVAVNNSILEMAWRSKSPKARTRIPAQVRGSVFSERSAYVLDAIWPIVRGIQWSKELEALYGKTEYTASLFDDEEVIYVSSLGRLIQDSSHTNKDPVTYTLVVSHSSKWRLGRLIDRLHSLGTLRLAALRDLSSLNAVSTQINFVSQMISRYENNSDDPPLHSIVDRFTNLSRTLDFDLSYRIGRSRYYVRQFASALKLMHSKPINGFQVYDDFVDRKVYDAFDFIDRLGYRYVDVRKRLEFARDTNEKLDISRLRVATYKNMTAISRHAETLTAQTEATNSLLNAAEWLSIFPITYYLGNSLFDSRDAIIMVQQKMLIGFMYLISNGHYASAARRVPTDSEWPYLLFAFFFTCLAAYLIHRLRERGAATNIGAPDERAEVTHADF